MGSKTRVMGWILSLTRGKALLIIMHGDEQYHRHFDRIVHLRAERRAAIVPAVAQIARGPDSHYELIAQTTSLVSRNQMP